MLITGLAALREYFSGGRKKELRSFIDKGRIVGVWGIRKFENDLALAANSPYAEDEFHNSFVNSGMIQLWDLVTGQGGTAFSNANANIGVGDSSTATTVTMTDLQAASNKLRVAMNATFPNAPANGLEQWQSNFTSAQANYAWNEFGVFNAAAAGTMLNRAVSTQGTKTSGQTWQITSSMTIS